MKQQPVYTPSPLLLWALKEASKREATSPYADYRVWLRLGRKQAAPVQKELGI